MQFGTSVPLRQASISAVIVRCRCGAPETHEGVPCPKGQSESLGTIAFWHKNAFHRLRFAVRRLFGLGGDFWV